MSKAIKIGDVVEDSYGKLGIVVREDPAPSRAWLAAQSDERLASLTGDQVWLAILPLDGGMVLCTEGLATRVRAAERADFRAAVAGANEHAVRLLVELFPAWTLEMIG